MTRCPKCGKVLVLDWKEEALYCWNCIIWYDVPYGTDDALRLKRTLKT
jgi:uncharacterized protein YbaR (Trm112 family)